MIGTRKVRVAMTSGKSSAAWLVAFLGFSSGLCAQQATTPTLEEILQRLEANLNHYDTRVPSLFCDEHVIAQVEPSLPSGDTVTDSIFRLKRTANPDETSTLVESREIKTINNKPATSQHMNGPAMLIGAFEGGLAVVSLDQRACMNYALQQTNRDRPAQPYIVRFATRLTPQNTEGCLLKENSNGRVSIDPASMQIARLELTTPRYVIDPGKSYTLPVVGRRIITVDYAPVLLGDETFWMPSAITMRIINDSDFNGTAWSFRATYRNYHKMEVTSRVLPGSAAPVP